MADPQNDIDSEEAFAHKEGVPSIDQPFIQKYLDGRDALVTQEKLQRSDHAFRETLSPMAREAAAIVSAIRFEEQQTLWLPSLEDDLAKEGKGAVYPGMMFSLAKERMEQSKLWKIIRKMPKGALLHCHLDAMGAMDWFIETAFSTPGICITSEQSLHTSEALEEQPFVFRFAQQKSMSTGAALWSESYEPNDLIPIATAAETFPNGGTDGFKKWIKSRVTITPEESISHHMGPHAVWKKFVSTFRILASLHRYEPVFKAFIRLMLRKLNEDGVRWVDIRTDFLGPYWREGQEQPDDDHFNMLDALEVEIDNFKKSEEGKNFWGGRVIWTTIRHGSTREIITDMKKCIEMKLEFPDLIGGYDLVGQEDIGRPLADLVPELFWFKKACAQEAIDIPFFLHAGETLGDGDSVDENLFDAVLLGTRRLGHGFSLYKHPLLIDMVKEKKILIESCPVSNEVLRFASSIMANPLPALIARGVPCALSNDDPAILGTGDNGMTHDFWQALQGWENLGLEGLASLAENSVRWANYEDCTAKDWTQSVKDGAYGKGVRAERMKTWAKEFEKFCSDVVLEYGPEHDINTLD
ncbi:adenosine deaminase family protein [Zymoseptoria brevis]|uniref:adenosine deaminase n=1 Tax=Zymoseptoria brevis TaxID=1047168 RepID=A0A0F4GGL0_9PEZI|nr:adenosine deaminase family protein [Zymoseptoria brevis]